MGKIFRSCLAVMLLWPVSAVNAAEKAVEPTSVSAEQLSAETVTVNDSVKWALDYSPRLKTLEFNQEALEFELDAAEGGYLPTLDLGASFGTDRHSDTTTRSKGADPSDSDWDARTEASLVLRQLLYDGGETRSKVDIQEAKLRSAGYRVKDNAESIALDAVIAHLAVVRQQRLVDLADQNIKDHEEILAHLRKRQANGAGNSADVSQAQGRLSRARASAFKLQADLLASRAEYTRVVGRDAGTLRFAEVPINTPESLNRSLELAVAGNPKILAFGEDIAEYRARADLAEAADYPKFFAEISERYHDKVEGDPSWEDTTAALVRLDWNLYRGGSDKARKYAARSRVRQSMEVYQNEVLDITEEVNSTWAKYQSATARITVYKEANVFNQETLAAYLKQFSVGQRSLLDVLSAENELFQSAGLLITSQINELIAAGRILALSGSLVDTVYPDTELPVLEPRTAKISKPQNL